MIEQSYTCAGCGETFTYVEEYEGQALEAAREERPEAFGDELFCGNCHVEQLCQK